MNFPPEALKTTRIFAESLAEGLSDEALNTVPEGFNNNIIWNLGHLVAAEQGVLYVRGGAQPRVAPEFLKAYARGTRPEGPVSCEGITEVKSLLTSTLPTLEADFAAGAFAGYVPWKTPYDVDIRSVDEALQFLLFHEGLHCGYIMALKRALGQS